MPSVQEKPPDTRAKPAASSDASTPKWRQSALTSLFDAVAPRYEFINIILSGGIVWYWDYRLLRELLAAPPKDRPGILLDLGCGQLPLRRALARRASELRVMGLDLSPGMLKKGRANLKPSATRRTLIALGSGAELPLAKDSLDLVICQFALRNMPDRLKIMGEALRALKPGGSIYVLELGSGRRRIWGGLYNFYLNRLLPLLAGLFFPKQRAAYDYLVQSILAFPPPEDLATELHQAGFTNVTYKALTSGVAYIHKGQKK